MFGNVDQFIYKQNVNSSHHIIPSFSFLVTFRLRCTVAISRQWMLSI